MTTVAGSGSGTWADGIGTVASFNKPFHVAISSNGANLYVADYMNNRIRSIVLATAAVTTLAGNGTLTHADGSGEAAAFYNPLGLAISADGATLYTGDGTASLYFLPTCIRAIDIASRAVTTLAGTGVAGFADGNSAQFNSPRGLAVSPDGMSLYVADYNNNRVRQVRTLGAAAHLRI